MILVSNGVFLSLTRMVNSGVDLMLVKDILGHSDIRATVRYAHAVTEQSLDAIESVSHYAEQNKKVIKLQVNN